MGRPTILSVAALVGTLFVALVLSSLLSLLQIGVQFFVAFSLSSSTGVDHSWIPDCSSSS